MNPPDKSTAPTKSVLAAAAPVQLTFLFLYSLPLLLTVWSVYTSSGFKYESDFVQFSLRVITQYVDALRDAFATFVVPFVTAYAVSAASSSKRKFRPIHLFFILVSLLLLSIMMLAFANLKFDDLVKSLPIENGKANEQANDLIRIMESYVKELLTYISLLLGVSAWKANA